MEKLIITVALTGAVTMPTQTPYLPITPQQLADEAVRAAEARKILNLKGKDKVGF
jgi:uncharacterized protein (DUF849 family)